MLALIMIVCLCTTVSSTVASAEGKIAFLYLTRLPIMPFEDVWREFFLWRKHSSTHTIYTHPPPQTQFSNKSFFHSTEIPERVEVKWGHISVVQASQLLVRNALLDKNNTFFVLLSESCIPIQPLSTWTELLLPLNKSISNVCRNTLSEKDGHRWLPSLNKTITQFRKSENWFALTRKHAEIYGKLDLSPWNEVDCADEHVIPSTLATLNLSNEAVCNPSITYLSWPIKSSHPKMFYSDEISAQFLQAMRSDLSCQHKISGTCFFAARKFSEDAAGVILDNLGILLNKTTETTRYNGGQWLRIFPRLRKDCFGVVGDTKNCTYYYQHNRFGEMNYTKIDKFQAVLEIAAKRSIRGKEYLQYIPNYRSRE